VDGGRDETETRARPTCEWIRDMLMCIHVLRRRRRSLDIFGSAVYFFIVQVTRAAIRPFDSIN
jgi:hypothetical protein